MKIIACISFVSSEKSRKHPRKHQYKGGQLSVKIHHREFNFREDVL